MTKSRVSVHGQTVVKVYFRMGHNSFVHGRDVQVYVKSGTILYRLVTTQGSVNWVHEHLSLVPTLGFRSQPPRLSGPVPHNPLSTLNTGTRIKDMVPVTPLTVGWYFPTLFPSQKRHHSHPVQCHPTSTLFHPTTGFFSPSVIAPTCLNNRLHSGTRTIVYLRDCPVPPRNVFLAQVPHLSCLVRTYRSL